MTTSFASSAQTFETSALKSARAILTTGDRKILAHDLFLMILSCDPVGGLGFIQLAKSASL
jgi:hypothetical protein